MPCSFSAEGSNTARLFSGLTKSEPACDIQILSLKGHAALLASEIYFGLTGAVSRLTAPLRDGASQDELVAHVTDYYDVTEADARADLARILAELQAAGLVVAAEA
ncbi:PqqD family protein [Tistrella mobilis]|uniref:PqqD family protein n=1 Tax=Tistrella mobilis TaxID=171437 RepID=UPI0031F61264